MVRHTAIAAFLLVTSIAGAQPTTAAKPKPAPPAKAIGGTAVAVSKAQLSSLHWLEGTWRGTGGGVPAFAEAYKFVNDTTIDVAFFNDSTGTKVSGTGKLVLTAGQLFFSGNGTEYAATKIAPSSVTFVPKGTNGKNQLEWTMNSPTAWTAVLKGGTGEVTPVLVTYKMSKIK